MRLDFIISVSTLLSLRGALVTNTKSTKRKKKRDRESVARNNPRITSDIKLKISLFSEVSLLA